MKSPHTGKPMPLHISRANMQYKGKRFWIHIIYYECTDTHERYTDDTLDALNTYQVYEQYANKHNLPIEEVIPKFDNVFKYKPGNIECPNCKHLQPHSFPMSGKLYCSGCGELLDEVCDYE